MIFQVCSNGTRVFVHKSIMGPFLAQLVERTKRMKIGDPYLEDTTVGATISKQQFDIVMRYIELAKKEVYILKTFAVWFSYPKSWQGIRKHAIKIDKIISNVTLVFTIMILKINDSLNLPSRLNCFFAVPHRVLVMNFQYMYFILPLSTLLISVCVCREPLWCVVGRESPWTPISGATLSVPVSLSTVRIT